MLLQGTEVKALREKAASLDEAYARITDDELWLIGCHIAPYAHGHAANHEPVHKRKLLVHGHEIRKWRNKVEQKGYTLIPLRIYFNSRGLAKITIALARGRVRADKREALKEREAKREMERAMRRKR
jgi:SsrA-binding protein